MNDEQIQVVEKDFRAISGRGDAFISRFYEIFFAAYPKAEELFSQTEWPVQTRKMLLTIMMVVDNLRDAAHIKKMLHEANIVHQKYTLQAHDFGALTDAMVKTLAEFVGDSWSSENETAWQAAFQKITAIMLEPIA
jgi:hemoglobin-like flavoprotein